MPHHVQTSNRVFKEISQVGEEIKMLAPALKGTKVVAETCILYSHDNDWTLQQPMQPNRNFNLREHVQLFYSALHDRNIPVDFARPNEDLSQYKLVFAPSLHLLSGGEERGRRIFGRAGIERAGGPDERTDEQDQDSNGQMIVRRGRVVGECAIYQ